MSWQEVYEIFDIASRVIEALAVIVVFVFPRIVVTRAWFDRWLAGFKGDLDGRYQKIDERLNKGDTRFAVIGTGPTRADFDGIKSEMNQMNGAMRALSAGHEALKERLEHIDDEVTMLVRLQLQGSNR